MRDAHVLPKVAAIAVLVLAACTGGSGQPSDPVASPSPEVVPSTAPAADSGAAGDGSTSDAASPDATPTPTGPCGPFDRPAGWEHQLQDGSSAPAGVCSWLAPEEDVVDWIVRVEGGRDVVEANQRAAREQFGSSSAEILASACADGTVSSQEEVDEEVGDGRLVGYVGAAVSGHGDGCIQAALHANFAVERDGVWLALARRGFVSAYGECRAQGLDHGPAQECVLDLADRYVTLARELAAELLGG